MATAVSSSSPVSLLSSGTVTPSVGAASPAPVAAVGGDPEVSDFNAVLSPLMGNAEAAVEAVDTILLTPETSLATTDVSVSALPPALPEGLDLTAVLQQAAAGAGNTLPADGKILPDSAGDVPVRTDKELTAQLTLPPAAEGGQPDSTLPVHIAEPVQAGPEPQDQGALMAELVLPVQGMPVAGGPETLESGAPTVEQNKDGATPEATTEQVLLPAAVTASPATQPAQADTASVDTLQTGVQVASTSLPSNSRPVAQRADTAKATALTPPSENVDSPAPAERAVSDLLSIPAGTDASDDVVRSAGFGRLLDAQTSANTSSQQPGSDSAAMGSKILTGAVAYRMDGTAQVATTLVSQPMDTPQWSNEIGERVVWFGANKIQNAEIELDPPELGPLQVRISTQNDQTSVTFTSHHAAVRDVLDQSLPRLKEMFAEQGLNLVQADVGERRGAPQQQQFDTQEGTASADSSGDDDTDVSATATATPSKMRLGLVDAYA